MKKKVTFELFDSLNYHLIFCVKYRRKVLTEKISERLKDIIINISKEFNTNITEQETDQDHVHVLFKSKPVLNISKFINSVKGISSRLLFQEFPEIRLKLWKGHLWSTSYCLLTTGQTTLDILKRYVQSQGKDIKTKNIDNPVIYKSCKICGW